MQCAHFVFSGYDVTLVYSDQMLMMYYITDYCYMHWILLNRMQLNIFEFEFEMPFTKH